MFSWGSRLCADVLLKTRKFLHIILFLEYSNIWNVRETFEERSQQVTCSFYWKPMHSLAVRPHVELEWNREKNIEWVKRCPEFWLVLNMTTTYTQNCNHWQPHRTTIKVCPPAELQRVSCRRHVGIILFWWVDPARAGFRLNLFRSIYISIFIYKYYTHLNKNRIRLLLFFFNCHHKKH